MFTQTIDCGYMLEPPHIGVSNEYSKNMIVGAATVRRFKRVPIKHDYVYTLHKLAHQKCCSAVF